MSSYVVYMGAHSHDASSNLVDYEKVTDSHYDFLGSFLRSKEKAKDAIFYSYTRSINGFAANLEEEEAQQISRHPNVISVFLNKRKKLHTTRSWGFLGLERDGCVPKDSLMAKALYGLGVIIANIDTGVWPESQSFNDTGLGPAPPRWKGTCETNTSAPVKCNRWNNWRRIFLILKRRLNSTAPRCKNLFCTRVDVTIDSMRSLKGSMLINARLNYWQRNMKRSTSKLEV